MTGSAVASVQVDNERLRVTRWDFAPGAATGFHRHEYDYVVVPLMDGRLKAVLADGSEQTAELRGGVSYARRAGVEHDIVNASDGDFAFVEIELK